MDDNVDRAPAEPAQTTRHTSLEGDAARDERMLKALIDQSATGLAIMECDFKYVRVNAAFAQHLGAVVGRFRGPTTLTPEVIVPTRSGWLTGGKPHRSSAHQRPPRRQRVDQ
jgi:hypothetical protein